MRRPALKMSPFRVLKYNQRKLAIEVDGGQHYDAVQIVKDAELTLSGIAWHTGNEVYKPGSLARNRVSS